MLCHQPDQRAGLPGGAEPCVAGLGIGGVPSSCPGDGSPLLATGRRDPAALRVACPFLFWGVHFWGQTGNAGLCPEPFPAGAAELSPASWERGRHLPPATSAGCGRWMSLSRAALCIYEL